MDAEAHSKIEAEVAPALSLIAKLQRERDEYKKTPVQFSRLAALVPPPRHPLTRFYGVWAPHLAKGH